MLNKITIALVFSVYSLSAHSATYSITNLGTLGESSYAYGLNNNGEVVGTSYSLGNATAFIWNEANGIVSLGLSSSTAYAINNSGTIVGGTGSQAFYGSNGSYSITDGGQYPNYHPHVAYDINDNGLAVVVREIGTHQSLIWDGSGLFQEFGKPGGEDAYAINNNGVIAAHSEFAYGANPTGTLYYPDGTYTDIGGRTAYDVNDSLVAVGADTNGNAFIWDSIGGYQNLGKLFGWDTSLFAVNEEGIAVGAMAQSPHFSAALYDGNSLVDLNSLINPSLGWHLTSAQDINDFGQIVGWGEINGVTSAFLLTPVPVPAAAWLFVSGLLGLVGVARHKKAA